MKLKSITTFFFTVLGLLCFSQISPTLPNTANIKTCLPDIKSYQTITVGPIGRNYTDLQLAINAAQAGTVIVLDAGKSFKGSFALPNKSGNDWIIITSSQINLLSKEGIRLNPNASTNNPNYPTQKDAMAKIITTNPSGLPCFKTEN
ncbi:MAG: hypothetical protein ABIO44_14210, partial [Saprospiraceae bacterium]